MIFVAIWTSCSALVVVVSFLTATLADFDFSQLATFGTIAPRNGNHLLSALAVVKMGILPKIAN